MVEGIRLLQEDLGSPTISQPTSLNRTPTLMADNQGGIAWCKSAAITKKLRHLNIREIAVRDAVASGPIRLGHVSGPLNLADAFTKEMKDDKHFLQLRAPLMSPRILPTGS